MSEVPTHTPNLPQPPVETSYNQTPGGEVAGQQVSRFGAGFRRGLAAAMARSTEQASAFSSPAFGEGNYQEPTTPDVLASPAYVPDELDDEISLMPPRFGQRRKPDPIRDTSWRRTETYDEPGGDLVRQQDDNTERWAGVVRAGHEKIDARLAEERAARAAAPEERPPLNLFQGPTGEAAVQATHAALDHNIAFMTALRSLESMSDDAIATLPRLPGKDKFTTDEALQIREEQLRRHYGMPRQG